MNNLIIFIAGLVFGFIIFLIYYKFTRKDEEKRMASLSDEALKIVFTVAGQELSKHIQSGEQNLDGKKQLIDQTLNIMQKDLKSVEDLIKTLEKDRELKFGEVTNQLKTANEVNVKLHEVTNQLKTALASSQVRGQWGERMAEDILRLAGFVEGVNYIKQKAMETSGKKPDYTFLLPKGLKVNMDVKFPLDNYLKYLEAESEVEKDACKKEFNSSIKQKIKDVVSRDYINPEENTVDYVLVFIPNEQVYGFINESDREILDESLKNKVILCSPLTLYAILAVIRHAIDNFNIEKTSSKILTILANFKKQWDMFVSKFDGLGDKIESVQKEYDDLMSTRKKQLDRSLQSVEDLKIENDNTRQIEKK